MYSYCTVSVMCMTLHVCIACISKNVGVCMYVCMHASVYCMYNYKCLCVSGCMYVYMQCKSLMCILHVQA